MPLSLIPAKTALVLIDFQTGTLSLPLAPYARADLLANTLRLAQTATAAGCALVPVRVAFAVDGADLPQRDVDQPLALPPGGLPPDWSDLDADIAALPASFSITKRGWSAFFGTELDLQLRRRGIDTLLIAGIATNFGVESTARDAWHLNYRVVVASDACTSVGAEMHRFALDRTLPRVARVRTVADIVAAL